MWSSCRVLFTAGRQLRLLTSNETPEVRGVATDAVAEFKSVARAVWLGRVRGAHPESEVPVRLRARAAQLRRAG